jgi:hypothetical protein
MQASLVEQDPEAPQLQRLFVFVGLANVVFFRPEVVRWCPDNRLVVRSLGLSFVSLCVHPRKGLQLVEPTIPENDDQSHVLHTETYIPLDMKDSVQEVAFLVAHGPELAGEGRIYV